MYQSKIKVTVKSQVNQKGVSDEGGSSEVVV
jgi:hypothetical protein